MISFTHNSFPRRVQSVRASAYTEPMRLKSELWVKAYLRTCASAGVPAADVRRGDDDAGVVFIKVARLDGTAALYGPAPAGLERDSGEPRWSLAATASDADIETRLAREKNLDSDIWIVEIEDREGRHFLDDWLASA